jgi:hypothetical protein
MKLCTDCKRDRLPDGGVQMSPTRWICAQCWRKFFTS